MAVDRSEVLLGSGDLYLVAYNDEIPADEVLEHVDNSVGRIKGGATLEYKPTEYEVTDDNAEVVKRFVSKEEVTFKSGILTWDMGNIAKLTPGSLVDSDPTERVLTIGGAKALDNYALRFVHTKDDGEKLRVTLVATAGNGFTLTFVGDKETVIDAEFKAISQDDGTLVELRESRGTVADTTPPTISTVSPADEAANQLATVNVLWTFSEAIRTADVTAANFAVFDESDNSPVAGVLSLTSNGTVVVFNPTGSLTAGGSYRCVVAAGVRDLAGNGLVAWKVTTFGIAA